MTPFRVRWPGRVATGSVTSSVACAIDWFPTLCEIVGIHRENIELDGESILPILENNAANTHDRTLVWRTGAHAELERESWYAVREGDWKWVQPPGEKALLFALAGDPGEKQDVSIARPEVARRLAELATQ